MSIFPAKPVPSQQFIVCPACHSAALPLLSDGSRLVAQHDCPSYRAGAWTAERRLREVYRTDCPAPGEWAQGALRFTETVNRQLPDVPRLALVRSGESVFSYPQAQRARDGILGATVWRRAYLNRWPADWRPAPPAPDDKAPR